MDEKIAQAKSESLMAYWNSVNRGIVVGFIAATRPGINDVEYQFIKFLIKKAKEERKDFSQNYEGFLSFVAECESEYGFDIEEHLKSIMRETESEAEPEDSTRKKGLVERAFNKLGYEKK